MAEGPNELTQPCALATSIVRHARATHASGFLRVVAVDSGRVLGRWEMPESAFRDRDDNPRGGLRGARGASAFGDRLVVANAERLFIFDPSWATVGEISHSLFGGIHDILAEADGIWVTCTSADLLVKVSWEGEVLADWEWRADGELRRALGLRRVPPVDRALDYRDPASMRSGVRNTVHLNGVSRCPAGLLLSFGRVLSAAAYRRARRGRLLGRLASAVGVPPRPRRQRSLDAPGRIPGSSAAIVLLTESGSTSILRRSEDVSIPMHNVLWQDDRVLFNDSNAGALVGGASASAPAIEVPIPGTPSFTRGLADLGQGDLLVGSQAPLALYRVNTHSGAITQTIDLEGQHHESVYSICPLPESFTSAESLSALHRL